MFDEAERGTEFNRYVREAKERASEPIDYNSLILWKLASALAARSGSNTRTHEIEDLINLLTPYLDEKWERDVKAIGLWKDKNYRGSIDNGKVHYLELAAIVNLMKRAGLTPMGEIDEGP